MHGLAVDLRLQFPIQLHANFEIRGFTALLGRSGAGKTSILKALAGLLPATGTPWDGLAPEARATGYLPQNTALFPHLTVLENTAYALRGPDRFTRAQTLLTELGLGELSARPATSISGGQAQRVALARALARGAQLLLLDEPASALDSATRNATLDWLIESITARNIPTLAATHDPEIAGRAAWLALLSGGRIIQQGTPRDLHNAPATATAAQLLGYENIWDNTAIRAADIEIAVSGLPATILSVREHGPALHINCAAPHPIIIHLLSGNQADYPPGATIFLNFPPTKLKTIGRANET
jgi:ABC-type Fe3+/spermidine/putrescine transport system ATPase subunit